MEGDYNEVHMW